MTARAFHPLFGRKKEYLSSQSTTICPLASQEGFGIYKSPHEHPGMTSPMQHTHAPSIHGNNYYDTDSDMKAHRSCFGRKSPMIVK